MTEPGAVEQGRDIGEGEVGAMLNARTGNDLWNSPYRGTLKVGFDDCVHQSLLDLGIAPEDLRLERRITPPSTTAISSAASPYNSYTSDRPLWSRALFWRAICSSRGEGRAGYGWG
ncbi:MAG: hypothetical protein WC993_07985 [Methanoculleus sp.]